MPRLRTAIVTGAVAAGVLAGCTGTDNDPEPGPTSGETATGIPQPTDDPDDIRSQLAEQATVTVECGLEQTVVAESGATVRIVGQCSRLLVDMSDGTVVATEIGTLHIIGDGNTLYADGIDRVIVEGRGNSVFWRTGDPVIEHDGVDNTLEEG